MLALAGTGSTQVQTQPHNGYWWVANSAEFKLGFVAGYVQAEINTQDRIFFKCLADKHDGKIPEKYPGDEEFKECREKTKDFDFNGLRLGQLDDGLDAFYKDFRNKAINIVPAINYVRDQLKGNKSARELESDLTLLRKQASSN